MLESRSAIRMLIVIALVLPVTLTGLSGQQQCSADGRIRRLDGDVYAGNRYELVMDTDRPVTGITWWGIIGPSPVGVPITGGLTRCFNAGPYPACVLDGFIAYADRPNRWFLDVPLSARGVTASFQMIGVAAGPYGPCFVFSSIREKTIL